MYETIVSATDEIEYGECKSQLFPISSISSSSSSSNYVIVVLNGLTFALNSNFESVRLCAIVLISDEYFFGPVAPIRYRGFNLCNYFSRVVKLC